MGLLSVILVFVFFYLLVTNVKFRYTAFHLPTVCYNAFVDAYKYVRFKRWNEFSDYGRMDIYIADEEQPFGSGKTLNMVRSALSIYKNYNNVEVYDFDKMEWVTQHIHILSNLKLLGVPYVPLQSVQQIIDIANGHGVPDDGNQHIYLVLIDELGRVFNNREWKNNISSDFLSALLQQRKNKIIIKGTVQDFSLFDATMRKVSAVAYSCSKTWRFLVLKKYFAKDIERAGFNTDLCEVRSVACHFADDRLYNSYDTNEVVKDIIKETQSGLRLTNEEILNASKNDADIATIRRLNRKFKRRANR